MVHSQIYLQAQMLLPPGSPQKSPCGMDVMLRPHWASLVSTLIDLPQLCFVISHLFCHLTKKPGSRAVGRGMNICAVGSLLPSFIVGCGMVQGDGMQWCSSQTSCPRRS